MLTGETFRSQQGYLLTDTGSVTFLPVLALDNINPQYLINLKIMVLGNRWPTLRG